MSPGRPCDHGSNPVSCLQCAHQRLESQRRPHRCRVQSQQEKRKPRSSYHSSSFSICIFCAPSFDAPNLIAPPVFDFAPRPVDPAGRTGRGRVAAAAAAPPAADDAWLPALLLLNLPDAPAVGLLTLPDEPPRSRSSPSQPPAFPAASQPPAAAAAGACAEVPLPLLPRGAAGLLLLVVVVAWDLADALRRLSRLRACRPTSTTDGVTRVLADATWHVQLLPYAKYDCVHCFSVGVASMRLKAACLLPG